MWTIKDVCVLLCILSAFSAAKCEEITVGTDLGDVRGVVLQSDLGKDFYAFRGIPYAKPPIKNLRFKIPEPVSNWPGVLDATEDGADCIQVNVFESVSNPPLLGDEDCLFANIFTPSISKETLLPVMVYIHGGGFASGSGSSDKYGPNRFMDKEIVLVTFNYRLGLFGFLSMNDSSLSGNYGLLDQVMALKFIQKHIRSFGGDPQRVTLFGQSAGGASVSFHQLYPISKGLFHSAILQSGNAVSDWAFDYENPFDKSKQLAERLHCPTTNSEAMAKCLRKRPALELISAAKKMLKSNMMENKGVFVFRPTLDNLFVTLTPKQQLISGNVNKVPTLSGITAHEGIQFLLMASPAFGGIDKMNSAHLPHLLPLIMPKFASKPPAFYKKIVEEYFGQVDNSDWNQRLLAFSKAIDSYSSKETDDFHFKMTNLGVPVYPYKFSYGGAQSWYQAFPEYQNIPEDVAENLKLVGHGDEIQYFFRSSYFLSSDLNKIDRKMAEISLSLWTDFAKSKKPLTVDEVIIRPLHRKSPHYLNLVLSSRNIDGYLCDKYEFWDNIFKENIDSKDEL